MIRLYGIFQNDLFKALYYVDQEQCVAYALESSSPVLYSPLKEFSIYQVSRVLMLVLLFSK